MTTVTLAPEIVVGGVDTYADIHVAERQGNSALWHIVITRMSTQPATKAYVERRTAEGLSPTEIMRCLKRYVSRDVFNALLQERRT